MMDYKPVLGFEDRVGRDSQIVLFLKNKLFELFRLFGYEQLEIPILEKKDFFTEKYVGTSPWPGWNEKSLFEVDIIDYTKNYKKAGKIEKGVLVPEGTLSVCRWVANQIIKQKFDISKILPLKLYYQIKCFRNEPILELSKRKKREFEQIGLELFGPANEMADAEVMYLITRGLETIGIPRNRIVMRIGNVKLFNQLIKLCHIERKAEVVLKEKIDNLAEMKACEKEDEARRIQEEIKFYLEKIGVSGSNLELWEKLCSFAHQDLEESISYIIRVFNNEEVASSLKSLGGVLNFLKIPFKIDLCVVRGQEYYSGVVFEVDVKGKDTLYLEVAGGGRYDQLLSKFFRNTDISIPATGFAYGVERLLDVVKNEGLKRVCSSVKYFLDEKSTDYVIFPRDMRKAWKAAEKMRKKWKRVDLYLLDNNRKKAKQYAQRKGARFLEI